MGTLSRFLFLLFILCSHPCSDEKCDKITGRREAGVDANAANKHIRAQSSPPKQVGAKESKRRVARFAVTCVMIVSQPDPISILRYRQQHNSQCFVL